MLHRLLPQLAVVTEAVAGWLANWLFCDLLAGCMAGCGRRRVSECRAQLLWWNDQRLSVPMPGCVHGQLLRPEPAWCSYTSVPRCILSAGCGSTGVAMNACCVLFAVYVRHCVLPQLGGGGYSLGA
jgi:hypothetical protein